MSIASKAALWFTICGFVQKGISFITVPIFTRLLTTEQYGVVSIFYSWESIFIIFCTLNLFSGVFNNGMIKYENDRDGFLHCVCYYCICYFLKNYHYGLKSAEF